MKNKSSVLTLFILCLSFCVLAQNGVKPGAFRAAYFNGKGLLIAKDNGYIEVIPYTNDLIKVTYKANSRETLKSFSVVAVPQHVQLKYSSSNSLAILKTPALTIVVDKHDLSVSFISNKRETLTKALNYIKPGNAHGPAIDFLSDGREAFYGGGTKAVYLNKRGQVLENYNQAHWDYKFGQTDLNIAIPFLVSNRKYGLFIDNAAKSTFDVCKTDPGIIRYSATSGLVSFFFVGGDSIDGVMANYTLLTGRQPLPPRWALGYLSSRYGYKSEKEITNVVDRTIKAGIPIDGVVFDLYWYKAADLMGNQNWARDSFPDPPRMLRSLLNKGVKVVPISETYITLKSDNFKYANEHHLLTSDFITRPGPHMFNNFWAGAAGLLDIFKPQAQQFYWSFYKARIKEGIAGWWFDLGEPESSSDSLRFALGTDSQVHNLYPFFWIRTAFNGYRKDFPQRRIFILPRSGYAGMQRYSTFPWSGDIDRSFNGLKAQIPIMLNMGLSGVAYIHSDAGGFTGAGEARKDPELYSRWLEFAAFTPVMRTHADATNYSPEPIFWDDTTRLRVTRYIKLRYSFLPYNYTLAYKNTLTGRPLMLPLNYFDTDNHGLSNINDEYLWGDQLLVAPVIVKGQTNKKVLFPKGEWIGFNDFKNYRDSACVAAPVDSLPLFVKAGSIIPMAGALKNTEAYNGQSLILAYYPGKSASSVQSTWYFDDGKDPNSLQNQKYDLVTFTSAGAGHKYTIAINPKHLTGRYKKFKLLIRGKQIGSAAFSVKTGYTINKNSAGNSNEINFDWDGRPLKLTIKTL